MSDQYVPSRADIEIVYGEQRATIESMQTQERMSNPESSGLAETLMYRALAEARMRILEWVLGMRDGPE